MNILIIELKGIEISEKGYSIITKIEVTKNKPLLKYALKELLERDKEINEILKEAFINNNFNNK